MVSQYDGLPLHIRSTSQKGGCRSIEKFESTPEGQACHIKVSAGQQIRRRRTSLCLNLRVHESTAARMARIISNKGRGSEMRTTPFLDYTHSCRFHSLSGRSTDPPKIPSRGLRFVRHPTHHSPVGVLQLLTDPLPAPRPLEEPRPISQMKLSDREDKFWRFRGCPIQESCSS